MRELAAEVKERGRARLLAELATSSLANGASRCATGGVRGLHKGENEVLAARHELRDVSLNICCERHATLFSGAIRKALD